MALDSVIEKVAYWGGFAWLYGIKPDLWEAAARSYQKNFNQLDKPHLVTLIDYRVHRNTPRLWTLGFFTPMPVLLCRTLVAHGGGTEDSRGGGAKDPAKISRQRGSNLSCVGGFVTKHIYNSKLGQKDKTKKRPALTIEGLDKSNDNARNRGIRMHGAHYVTNSKAAHTFGCISCKQEIHEELIKIIQGGSFIYSFAGNQHEDL